jgi:N-acetylglutamate synthase-like GNAT family acetyltransferase
MNPPLSDIAIRTDLRPGDIGYITYLHGKLYGEEYNYGIEFETYVARGLAEFHKNYDPLTNRVWICEHGNKMIGCILLMDRGEAAQLRYFLIEPAYRGIGLGQKLMDLYFKFLKQCGYKSAYLWTTNEQSSAAHLYSKYGFILTEEKQSTAFGKHVKEQRYQLIL